jgi:RNA polymerase sigma factor (sigma-70 family)
MVLRVCRSILRHEQDAEDAFQATFLILARKADSIRQPEAMAGWLSEVAYRVASKAQAESARRRCQERRDTPMAAADPALEMTLRDLQRVLHEELRHLPDKYRVPLVLCYLEGRSHEEAARQLGWSTGKFRGRLDRGREHLRRRLTARGVALSAVLCGMTVAPAAAAEGLVDAVVRAVGHSTPSGAGGALPARVAALADGVIRTMYASKLKVVMLGMLALGMLVGAGALAREAMGDGATDKPATPKAIVSAKPQAAASAKPQAAQEKDLIAFRGRVLDPEGKPVAGAKLFLTPWWSGKKWLMSPPPCATSAADGRFVFTVPKSRYREQATVVTATAPKHGAGWVEVPGEQTSDDLTIRLVRDDVPITGQIVDLEARPVAGVTLQVERIDAAAGDDLDPWLKAVRNKKGFTLQLRSQFLRRDTYAVSTKVTTDEKGRFRLTGIGRNRVLEARLDGPTIVSQRISILTRPGKTFEVPNNEGNPEYGEKRTVTVYYGANFQHVAAPSKPIVGVIRDRDTKKPLAGFTIQSMTLATNPIHIEHINKTKSDEQGRYRLMGMPKGMGSTIMVIPSGELPYVAMNARVPDSPGLDAVALDFEMRRGVWIEGRITDKVTGKGVKSSVEYFSMYNNPNLRDYPGFDGTFLPWFGTGTKEDGTYRVAGLPGPGLVVVWKGDNYVRVTDRKDEFGIKERSLMTAPYHLLPLSNYVALARVNPAKGAESARRDVTLEPLPPKPKNRGDGPGR